MWGYSQLRHSAILVDNSQRLFQADQRATLLDVKFGNQGPSSFFLVQDPAAIFLVPDWGMKLSMASV
jgi:16S rRNA C1402 N4-methylase RsmH